MWRYISAEEMYHTGVIGMRWRKRIAKNHVSLSQHITKKKQIEFDKRDKNNIKKQIDKTTKKLNNKENNSQILAKGILRSIGSLVLGNVVANNLVVSGRDTLALLVKSSSLGYAIGTGLNTYTDIKNNN